MFTLAALQASVFTVKYGITIDNALAQSILDNPVAFETEVPKGNIKGTALPPVSISKDFDVEKQSYIAFNKSEDGKYLNLSLTNVKPKNTLDANKDVIYMMSTSYKDVSDKDKRIAAIIAALK